MTMKQRWIKASELSEYLYCQRAWWYRLQGLDSANVKELTHGTAEHVQHSRGVRWVVWQRSMAFMLIVAAVVLLVIQMI